MTDAQLDALRYYVNAVALLVTRDVRHSSADFWEALYLLEAAFDVRMPDRPAAPSLPDLL